MASIGRGRGKLLSQMVGLFGNSEHKLMTPGQFSNPCNKDEVTIPAHDQNIEDQFVINEKDVEVKKNEELIIVPKTPKAKEIPQEDIDWQVYKFTRKVKETLKSVNKDNFNEVLGSIKELYQDYPLSSRFRGDNCSEVKHILDVLIQKSISDNDFVMFAPRFIRMIHGHSEIEFLQHFPNLIQDRRKEVINVCASQESVLPESAKKFCQLLGKLFLLPRQIDNKFYDVISGIVEEYVESWTIISESEGTSNFSGHSLAMAQVKATAVHVLIKEISHGMYDCDSEVRTKMEKFVWSLRESVLNNQLPRALKETYLDALIDIQCISRSDVGVQNTDVETSDDEIEIEIEEDEEENVFENHKEKDGQIEVGKYSVGTKDDYLVVKYFLNRNDLDDLLPDFIDNELTDQKLSSTASENWMAMLQISGVSKLLSRNVMKIIQSKDWKTWTTEASSSLNNRSARSSLSNRMAIAFPSPVPLNNKTQTSPSSPTKTNNSFNQNLNNISSSEDHQSFSNNIEKDQNFSNISLPDENSLSRNNENNLNLNDYNLNQHKYFENVSCSEDNDDNSDPDIEIEEDGEDEEESSSSSTPILNTASNIPKRLTGSGRGRGMVKFHDNRIIGSKQKSYVPVAKIPPTGRTSFDNDRTEQCFNHNNGEERRQNYNNNRKPGKRLNQQYKNNKPRNNSPFQARPQPGRFQPVYHPKSEPPKKQETEKRIEFGKVKPKMCFMCSSLDHTSEECNVINPFF